MILHSGCIFDFSMDHVMLILNLVKATHFCRPLSHCTNLENCPSHFFVLVTWSMFLRFGHPKSATGEDSQWFSCDEWDKTYGALDSKGMDEKTVEPSEAGDDTGRLKRETSKPFFFSKHAPSHVFFFCLTAIVVCCLKPQVVIRVRSGLT